jgi:hypothetical protein
MQAVAAGTWPNIPGAPTIGTATAGALSASVTFTAPAYVGTGITGYTVTSSPGGVTGTGASSPVVVSGLTAGTAYTFTVTASTAGGTGPASAASNSVTPTPPVYIEDIYSTYLYTGSGTSKTITNNIDLSTKGGLVWTKMRTSPVSNAHDHRLSDSSIGVNQVLSSNNTNPKTSSASFGISAFNVDGYTITNPGADGGWNYTNDTFVSWTFRKQPKFFDVVTWTGDDTVGRQIPHNLGSVPGCIITKCLTAAENWNTYHRSLGNQTTVALNTTGAGVNFGSALFNSTDPTSTYFTTGTSLASINGSGRTYVAYLFAHNAGGFGLTSTDNVISCGSYTGNGSTTGPIITLGYEPQWLMIKRTNSTGSWYIFDNMRGLRNSGGVWLVANTADVEDTSVNIISSLATGFQPVQTGTATNGGGDTYIYIAIRRGPMKVPTVGTSVFSTTVQTGVNTSAGQFITTGFPPDLSIEASAGVSSGTKWTVDRLRGNNQFLDTASTAAESSLSPYGINYTTSSVGVQNVDYGTSAISYVDWLFRRAPSFFDEVCYTGDSTGGRSITHNLGVVPEILIVKKRSSGAGWPTLITSAMRVMEIDNDSGYRPAGDTQFFYGDGSSAIAPTSSVFTVASGGDVNGSGSTYVAYLFASCLGVSKVGAYTGNGSTQTINCGFTGGARFVLIKRTDTNGEWYVYDTARGMTSGTAPYTSLDNSGGSTATAGSVTTVSTGFALDAAVLAAINTNGASYIFLAIA